MIRAAAVKVSGFVLKHGEDASANRRLEAVERDAVGEELRLDEHFATSFWQIALLPARSLPGC